jgi:hypothetical protein
VNSWEEANLGRSMCENKFQLVITNFQPDTPYEDFDLISSSLSIQ